jgi:hypothetical protein
VLKRHLPVVVCGALLAAARLLAQLPSTDKRLESLQRYTVADSATWALPAVAGNRRFVKDTNSLALWTWWLAHNGAWTGLR